MQSRKSTPNEGDFLIHLSHNDLDGAGCHYLTRHFQKASMLISSSYEDIDLWIDRIANMAQTKILNGEKVFVLVTDISISKSQCTDLDNRLPRRCGVAILDHHITTKSCSDIFEWCVYDNSKSATLLTYEFYGSINNKFIKTMVGLVNISDLGLSKSTGYSVAEFLSQQIYEMADMPEAISDIINDYRFYLIERITEHRILGASVLALEQNLPFIRIGFLRYKGVEKSIVENYDLSYLDKLYYLIGQYIDLTKIPTVHVGKECIGVFFHWQDNLYRHLVMSNERIKKEYDYAVLIKVSGRLSLRALRETSNAALLMETFFNGGGHRTQAGGKIPLKNCETLDYTLYYLRGVLAKREKLNEWNKCHVG